MKEWEFTNMWGEQKYLSRKDGHIQADFTEANPQDSQQETRGTFEIMELLSMTVEILPPDASAARIRGGEIIEQIMSSVNTRWSNGKEYLATRDPLDSALWDL